MLLLLVCVASVLYTAAYARVKEYGVAPWWTFGVNIWGTLAAYSDLKAGDLALCKRLHARLEYKVGDLKRFLDNGSMCYVAHKTKREVSISGFVFNGATVRPEDGMKNFFNPFSGDFLRGTRERIIGHWLFEVVSLMHSSPVESIFVALASLQDGIEGLPIDAVKELQDLGIPFLAMSSTKTDTDSILIPDVYFVANTGYRYMRKRVSYAAQVSPWEGKGDRAFFRGASTGATLEVDNWMDGPRVKAALMSKSYEFMDVGISSVTQVKNPEDKELITSLMKEKGALKAEIPLTEAIRRYKVLIDIDGNTNSWQGAFWKLLSNCLTVKVECEYRQWWYPRLVPWEHYVPATCDMSDLPEKVLWGLNASHAEAVADMVEKSTRLMESITYAETLTSFASVFSEFRRPLHEHPLVQGRLVQGEFIMQIDSAN